jgi:DGQHR domain-containing protein
VLKALKVSQPIGDFYVVVMPSSELTEIAYADVRTLDDRELDSYLGIQRRLDKKRVKELRDYVRTSDASFPTSVLLAITSDHAKWREQDGTLTLVSDDDGNFHDVGKILDGQHRVAGLEEYSGPTFDICVCIFVDADLADQASIFSTVNLAQTKVNKSLVYDLYDYQKARSPQKTAHNVALALDRVRNGPFDGRIKRLGFAEKPGQLLTQATVVEELLALISKQPAKDRDDLIRGKSIARPTEDELRKTPLRLLFLLGNDSAIAANMTNFFEAVRKKWPHAWEGKDQGQILPKTNGFKSLMWGLGEFYRRNARNFTEVFEPAQYTKFLNAVDLTDDQFTVDLFQPGSGGQSTLKRYLRAALEGKPLATVADD